MAGPPRIPPGCAVVASARTVGMGLWSDPARFVQGALATGATVVGYIDSGNVGIIVASGSGLALVAVGACVGWIPLTYLDPAPL